MQRCPFIFRSAQGFCSCTRYPLLCHPYLQFTVLHARHCGLQDKGEGTKAKREGGSSTIKRRPRRRSTPVTDSEEGEDTSEGEEEGAEVG